MWGISLPWTPRSKTRFSHCSGKASTSGGSASAARVPLPSQRGTCSSPQEPAFHTRQQSSVCPLPWGPRCLCREEPGACELGAHRHSRPPFLTRDSRGSNPKCRMQSGDSSREGKTCAAQCSPSPHRGPHTGARGTSGVSRPWGERHRTTAYPRASTLLQRVRSETGRLRAR